MRVNELIEELINEGKMNKSFYQNFQTLFSNTNEIKKILDDSYLCKVMTIIGIPLNNLDGFNEVNKQKEGKNIFMNHIYIQRINAELYNINKKKKDFDNFLDYYFDNIKIFDVDNSYGKSLSYGFGFTLVNLTKFGYDITKYVSEINFSNIDKKSYYQGMIDGLEANHLNSTSYYLRFINRYENSVKESVLNLLIFFNNQIINTTINSNEYKINENSKNYFKYNVFTDKKFNNLIEDMSFDLKNFESFLDKKEMNEVSYLKDEIDKLRIENQKITDELEEIKKENKEDKSLISSIKKFIKEDNLDKLKKLLEERDVLKVKVNKLLEISGLSSVESLEEFLTEEKKKKRISNLL